MAAETAHRRPSINAALATAILTRFIRSEIRRAGFRPAVLGLSGASTPAWSRSWPPGPWDPKTCWPSPCPTRPPATATRSDGQAVIGSWASQSLDVPITAQIDAYFARFPEASQMRLANKCARERMTCSTIRARPSRGWCWARATRASCCWATARSSATWPRPSIRSAIFTRRNSITWRPTWACRRPSSKTPTGDLWIGQTDEGELGFTYAEVDRLLVLLVDRRWRRAELFAGRL